MSSDFVLKHLDHLKTSWKHRPTVVTSRHFGNTTPKVWLPKKVKDGCCWSLGQKIFPSQWLQRTYAAKVLQTKT